MKKVSRNKGLQAQLMGQMMGGGAGGMPGMGGMGGLGGMDLNALAKKFGGGLKF